MNEPLLIQSYNYELPENKIAKFPLQKRDETKLLAMINGNLSDSEFVRLPDLIADKSLFIFNNTRVINARLVFQKPGGARIEIFCLNPYEQTSQSGNENKALWKCYIGNSKRWKSGSLELSTTGITSLKATRLSTQDDTSIVLFEWDDPSLSFEKLLELYGKIPLPPYLNREPVETDRERYQTVYAIHNGSVAAPTAGLHFTDSVLANLEKKECVLDYVTLHVGAGTFKPVTTSNALEHKMHEEKIIVHRDTISRLISKIDDLVVAVGTTSMRTLESLYWLGHQIISGDTSELQATGLFRIGQWDPYESKGNIATIEALTAIYDYMKNNNLNEISGYTEIMIVPGYSFRICKALVTNFHQPQSTLLLLVAAFIGENWKKAYSHALNNNYRFLSYGDSCLFIP
jgi:S-adenosylmethionine:tRNA ribosyltransferase-isomerase